MRPSGNSAKTATKVAVLAPSKIAAAPSSALAGVASDNDWAEIVRFLTRKGLLQNSPNLGVQEFLTHRRFVLFLQFVS